MNSVAYLDLGRFGVQYFQILWNFEPISDADSVIYMTFLIAYQVFVHQRCKLCPEFHYLPPENHADIRQCEYHWNKSIAADFSLGRTKLIDRRTERQTQRKIN